MAIIGNTSLASYSLDLVLQNVSCDSSVSVGDWVRLDGNSIVKALADSKTNANVLGLVEFKATATLANVRIGGVSKPIFNGLDTAKEYLLSDLVSGGMTPRGTNTPSDPGHVIVRVGQPVDDKRILILKGTMIVRS